MRRHHDARTPREVATGLAGELAARLGALPYAGGDVVEFPQYRLVDELARSLGESNVVAAVGAGPPRRNRKPVIQLLRPNGTTIGFAKIGWSEMTRSLVRNEAAWLKAVAGHLPAPLEAPRVLLHEMIGGNDVVVTTPLVVTPRFGQPDPVDDDVIVALGRCLGSSTRSVRDIVNDRRWSNAAAELIGLESLVAKHGETIVEAGLWHGDFTPWNMASTKNERLIWDWEFAGDDRPVGFDLIHREMERVRRSASNNEDAAVAAAMAYTSPALPLEAKQLEATRCLYLAEIVARETSLAGQGWVPESLGPLDQVAASTLAARLS